jgi:hypothetical protein
MCHRRAEANSPPNERMNILLAFTKNLRSTSRLYGKLYIHQSQLLVIVAIVHHSPILTNGKAVFVQVAVDLNSVPVL